jgi:uncharacterized membrane protein
MQSFLPFPLHPAIVHFPIALSVLLPFFAVGAIWAIRRGTRPRLAWGVTTALFAALTVSSWAAVQTGEQQDERVEDVVAEAPIHSHEEAAEAFLMFSLGMLGVAAVGLVPGRLGSGARLLGALGSVALLGAGYQVGHSGGELVYQYGAASAYTTGGTVERAGDVVTEGGRERGAAPSARRDDDDR